MGDDAIVKQPTELVPTLAPASDYMMYLEAWQVDVAERYLTHYDLNRAIQEIKQFKEKDPDKPGRFIQQVYNLSCRLRQNDDFLNYLAARMSEIAMPADRVLRELAKIASVSIEDFLNDELLEQVPPVPMFDFAKAKRLNVLGCIKKLELVPTAGGRQAIRFELYDKLRALEDLAKHFNLLAETEVKIDQYVINVVRTDEVIEVQE